MVLFTNEQLYNQYWYAVNTKCRHEKQVAERLSGKNVETFLPLRRLQRRWKDRTKLVEFPLFPGYLFVRIPLTEKNIVLHTPSVVRMIGRTLPVPVPDKDIFAIQRFIEAEIECDPYPYLIPGREVEVVRGPLKYVRGFISRKKGKYRLIINVGLLNNSIATEIDADDVQPV